MNALIYGVALQWKLDIRSKSLLITCYVVPLIFFAIMGGIFTSILPDAKEELIQSMTVMGVSMGALLGLPPSLVEIYGSDIKKVYKANGVPLYLGLISLFLSAFSHLLIMSAIIFLTAPIAFDAALPVNIPQYFLALAIFIIVSLSIGSILGLSIKNQSKLIMVSQLIFLPSMMLSGIMFSADLLPKNLRVAGKLLPASSGYQLMLKDGFVFKNLWILMLILFIAVISCILLLNRLKSE